MGLLSLVLINNSVSLYLFFNNSRTKEKINYKNLSQKAERKMFLQSLKRQNGFQSTAILMRDLKRPKAEGRG